MKKLVHMVICCLWVIAAGAQEAGNEMMRLAQMKKGIQSKRVSSFDTTGGNRDHLTKIQPGHKKVLFDVKGAGVINHIWITIAPSPPTIQRDDIILRMYWDGNNHPSVESPLGSFFGQGWNEAYPYYTQPLNVAPGEANALVCFFCHAFC